jgi:dihydrofolate reductase
MNLIVAVDLNWGIGKGGTQTVVIPEDRKHFRALTDGGTVIVGHRTLLDFPGAKPLPGRQNIVFSRQRDLTVDGASVVHTLDELRGALDGTDPAKVFVIGGDTIFKLLLPYCARAFVTKLAASPEADSFFPNLDALPNWVLADPGALKNDNGIEYAFQVYKNTSPLSLPDSGVR